MMESPIFESWKANSAHEIPRRSVPRFAATVGMDMLKILAAVAEKKVPSMAVPRSR